MAQSVTPPLHPSRESPRPPAPLARRPPPRHRPSPAGRRHRATARDRGLLPPTVLLEATPLLAATPGGRIQCRPSLSSSPTGSMEASGASRSFLSLPGEQASRRSSGSRPRRSGRRGGRLTGSLCARPAGEELRPPHLRRAEELRRPARAWGGASLPCSKQGRAPLTSMVFS